MDLLEWPQGPVDILRVSTLYKRKCTIQCSARHCRKSGSIAASSELPWSLASLMVLITSDLKAHLNEDKPNFVPSLSGHHDVDPADSRTTSSCHSGLFPVPQTRPPLIPTSIFALSTQAALLKCCFCRKVFLGHPFRKPHDGHDLAYFLHNTEHFWKSTYEHTQEHFCYLVLPPRM